MLKFVAKKIFHLVSGNRRFYYRELKKIAKESEGKVILEIGSGKKVNGKYSYSASHLFPDAKEFIMTDVDPKFGHRVLDITKSDEKDKYDIVLCLNVLEHVYDYNLAIANLRKSLKSGGLLVIAVPFAFPLHDEPNDYWRFTEHTLKIILKEFSHVDISNQRFQKLPTGYFVLATK